jgi:hypothetical protein
MKSNQATWLQNMNYLSWNTAVDKITYPVVHYMFSSDAVSSWNKLQSPPLSKLSIRRQILAVMFLSSEMHSVYKERKVNKLRYEYWLRF